VSMFGRPGTGFGVRGSPNVKRIPSGFDLPPLAALYMYLNNQILNFVNTGPTVHSLAVIRNRKTSLLVLQLRSYASGRRDRRVWFGMRGVRQS
jgi:hypothetical protein